MHKTYQNHGWTFRYFSGSYDDAIRHNGMIKHQPFSTGWAGESESSFAIKLRQGDVSQVERAQRLVDMMESEFDFDAARKVWTPDVVGAMPNVQAYLAGVPETMFRLADDDAPQGEVVIFCDLFLSASFDKSVAARRGAALIALAMYLSSIRPVRLIAGTFEQDTTRRGKRDLVGCFYDLPSAPVDLSRAGMALANPAFMRRFVHDVVDHISPNTLTASWRYYGISEKLAIDCIADMTGAENIILTPDLVSGNGAAPFKSDESAAQWVKDQIKPYLPE